MVSLPQIDHPEIPEGDYCYTIKEIVYAANGRPTIKINCCPHWKVVNRDRYGKVISAKCMLLNVEDDFLLWDQVKICGINNTDIEE